MSVKEKVNSFMRSYQMDAGHINIDDLCDSFIAEMTAGLTGEASSLPMLPTYLHMENHIPINEKVIVIDAGGSNLRVALAWFDKMLNPVIENISLHKMPGSLTPINREEFYNTIADHLKPYLMHSNKIGFCFSYQTETQPNRDGRLIRLSKEVTVHGLDGDLIGANLLERIKTRFDPSDRSIVILNDTTACLLGGAFSNAHRTFDGFIGLIMGTGTNTCYVENNLVINIESGCFDKAPRGLFDLEVDQATSNPGDHVFEKMIAGHYQGALTQRMLMHAIEDGLFSHKVPASELVAKRIGARDIDDHLNFPYENNGNLLKFLSSNGIKVEDTDREALFYLIDAIIERSALLVMANISAIMTKTTAGRNPCRPVCVTVDGSTFYKSKFFRDKLIYYVRTYMNDRKEQHCEFIKAENGNLIGTAAAGLQNWR